MAVVSIPHILTAVVLSLVGAASCSGSTGSNVDYINSTHIRFMGVAVTDDLTNDTQVKGKRRCHETPNCMGHAMQQVLCR